MGELNLGVSGEMENLRYSFILFVSVLPAVNDWNNACAPNSALACEWIRESREDQPRFQGFSSKIKRLKCDQSHVPLDC